MKKSLIGREVQTDYPADRLLPGGTNAVLLSPVACGTPFPEATSRAITGGRICIEGGTSKEEPASGYMRRLMCTVVIAIVEQIFRFLQIVDIIVFIVERQFLLYVFLDLFSDLFLDIFAYLFFV